jgi:hypothetical protein
MSIPLAGFKKNCCISQLTFISLESYQEENLWWNLMMGKIVDLLKHLAAKNSGTTFETLF